MNEIEREPDVDWQELRPALDEALRTLHEEDREAVLLRYFERQAFADIGRTLHLSEDAARMRVDRALDRLRSFLSRRGVSSSAAALAAVLGNQVSAAPAGLALVISGARGRCRQDRNAGKDLWHGKPQVRDRYGSCRDRDRGISSVSGPFRQAT